MGHSTVSTFGKFVKGQQEYCGTYWSESWAVVTKLGGAGPTWYVKFVYI